LLKTNNLLFLKAIFIIKKSLLRLLVIIKQMKNRLFIILSLSCLMLISCTKEIEIDIPEVKTKLVLNGLFTNDSVFCVNVSRTTNFSQNITKYISDATVELYQGNRQISNFIYTENGIYKSTIDYKPEIGKTYTIKILHDKYDNLYAENKVPLLPNVIQTEKTDSAYIDEDGYYGSEAEITINDSPNNKNYYEIKLIGYYFEDYSGIPGYENNQTEDTVWHTRRLYLTGNDVVLLNEGLTDYYPSEYPFSDTLFNGQSYTLKVHYLPPQTILVVNDGEYNLAKNYQLIVVINSVSEAYYKYKKKLIIHTENQSGDIWDGTANPVNMFSNIEGGYGIFAGYSSYIDTIP